MWDFIAKLDGRRQLRRWLLTIHGTGVPMDFGPPADVARAVGRYYDWQPVGYPAAVFPMRPSVDAGVVEGLRLLDEVKPPDQEWALEGYSQGAVVAVKIYQHLKATNSRHLKTLKAAVTWGNPCREQGVAHGNRRYGWPMPDPNSSGIAHASERMVNTPDWWLDFVNVGDIYTDTPRGRHADIGEDMTMVYQIVMDPLPGLGLGWAPPGPNPYPTTPADKGEDTAIEQVTELMDSPLREFPAAVGAILNGLGFITGPGGPTYVHLAYDTAPAIDYLTTVAEKVVVAA